MNTIFNIKSAYLTQHDTSYGGYRWKYTITIEMPIAVFNQYKKSGNLGHIYNTDVCHELTSRGLWYHGYSVPSVDDTRNARKGVKTIEITHYFNNDLAAEQYGVKFKTLRNGIKLTEEFSPCIQLVG